MLLNMSRYSETNGFVLKCFCLFLAMGWTGCTPNTATNSPNGTNPDKNSTESDVGASTGSEKPADGGSVPSGIASPSAPPSESSAPLSAPQASADSALMKRLVEQCIATYQTLKSYEDEGVLQLSIPYPDQPLVQTRPLAVAFERPRKLAMRTPQLRSSWKPLTFESVAGDDEFKPFENQRVVRPLPDRITWSWLLEDHLGVLLNRRAWGIPLSIELLLAGAPLQDWLEKGEFRKLGEETFDGVLCTRVEIVYEKSPFVLWIDSKRNLILRMEMPIESVFPLPRPIPEGLDRSKCQFSIDLVNVRTNHAIDWSRWTLPESESDLLVRRFVDPPLRNIPKELGTKPNPVLLKGPSNEDVFDTTARAKRITVLHWIDDSDTIRAFVDDVYQFQKSLQERGLTAFCEIVLVSDKPADRMAVTLKSWNCDLPVGLETKGELGGQCGVANYLTSVILGPDGSIQSIDPVTDFSILLSKVQALQEGEDLAKRFLKVAVDDEARYASRLHRNILDKGQIARMRPSHQEIAPFPLSFHTIALDWRCPLDNPTVSAAGEWFPNQSTSSYLRAESLFEKPENAYRLATLLDDQGRIWGIDQQGKKSILSTVSIAQATDAKRIHVLPDPWTHNYVAILPEGLPRFWYCVAPTSSTPSWTPTDAAQIPLEPGESAIGAAWACKEGLPILCIITDRQRFLQLNPATTKLDISRSTSTSPTSSIVGVIPQIDAKSVFESWKTTWSDRTIQDIPNFAIVPDGASNAATGVATSELSFVPELGNWVWGQGAESYLVGLEKMLSGETGAVLMNRNYQPLFRQVLSVRPEQCKLLAATQTSSGKFYWLATAPNRVLHLQSVDAIPDQMSFGKRVFGATLLADGDKLRMVVVLEDEVSSWTIQKVEVKQ